MESEQVRMCPTVESLPTGWQVKRLGSFCTKIGTGATPRGGSEVYLNTRISHALVRSQHVFDRRFDLDGLAFISELHAKELRNAEVQSGDVLLNITGDGVTFGRSCIIPDHVLPACVNQHVSIIRPDRRECEPGYLLAVLTHPAAKGYIESFNSGGSRRAITKGHIESFEIPLPPLAEQKAIAAVLGALDDKIELNRRMNATLEAMARALFQSWFVDFDPVRAKLDGRTPPGMDEATAALFSDSFDRSDDLLRPRGWHVSRLGDHVNLVRGNTYKSKLKDLPGPYLFGLGSIHRNGGFRSDSLRTYGGESAPKLILRPGDLFVSLKDVTQAADLLGAVARVPAEIPAGRLTQDTVKLVPSGSGISFAYLYHTLLRPEYREYCRGRATGTTNLGLSRDDFLNYPVFVPTREVQQAFDRIDSQLDALIANNRVQSRTLATLRDTLLPNLLCGELSVAGVRI